MTPFDSAAHPRGHASNAGSFSEKEQGKPEISALAHPAGDCYAAARAALATFDNIEHWESTNTPAARARRGVADALRDLIEVEERTLETAQRTPEQIAEFVMLNTFPEGTNGGARLADTALMATARRAAVDAAREAMVRNGDIDHSTPIATGDTWLTRYRNRVEAGRAKIEFDEDAHKSISSIPDSGDTELRVYDVEGVGERLFGANDLVDEFGLSGQLDLTPYRETPDSILVLKIKLAGDDERERLVDDATDDERLELAVHPNADIRFLVARSPETDADTLNSLLEDSDENVAAAAEHSLGS